MKTKIIILITMGFVVFTAEYLLQRGYCCGNGCANCPYDYKNVPEPKRSERCLLREEEKIRNRKY